jgi:GTPase
MTQQDFAEFQELALSAGAKPVAVITSLSPMPQAKYLVGTGKAEEIKSSVECNRAELVIVNYTLTPSQERNLETLFKCRVLDRTGLILDIFAQRAHTFEGKLQVELAQLQYISTRLIRGWTHLERQKGGIGLRGPGETQLETDRRLIRNRIKTITQRLDKVRFQRGQRRRSRSKVRIPTVSIVGYTNAGKSHLFNTLTASSVYTADQLFATLDPTLRRIEPPSIGKVILADTVGFIRHLPPDLVDAFRATLEEIQEADLLLHVVDAQHPHREDLISAVNSVLYDIKANHIPQLLVFNKIDLLPGVEPHVTQNYAGPQAVWISALTGAGIDLLYEALVQLLGKNVITRILHLNPMQGKLRAALYHAQSILHEEKTRQGWTLTVRMPKKDLESVIKRLDG